MKDNMNIYFGFVICLGFMICLLSIVALTNQNRNMQTEIDELRLLFNQKFLQEMVTDEPKLRTLEYRPDDQAKLFRISI
jgi:hypothetical protein